MEILEFSAVLKEYEKWLRERTLVLSNDDDTSGPLEEMVKVANYHAEAATVGMQYCDIVLVRHLEGEHPHPCLCNVVSAFAFGVPLSVAMMEEKNVENFDATEASQIVETFSLFLVDNNIAAVHRSKANEDR